MPPEALIAALFTHAVVTAEAVPHDVDDQLFPEERAYLARALPRRRFEFGSARVCARRALSALGHRPSALVPRPDRQPAWPTGIVGSISHTDGYCAVAVAHRPPLRSLGLDVQTVRAIEPRLVPAILTPRERAFVDARPAEQRADLITLHFSAKEAYYKCQYPLTEQSLRAQDVEIDLALTAGTFLARRLAGGPEALRQLAGRYVFVAGRVLCGVELGALGARAAARAPARDTSDESTGEPRATRAT